jgi:hypothetical protein
MDASNPRRRQSIGVVIGALCLSSGVVSANQGAVRFDFDAPDTGSGVISPGFQTLSTQGSLDRDGGNAAFLRNLCIDSRSLILGVDYRFNSRWSTHVSLPYIRNRARKDIGAHNPTRLVPARPASEFIDDGEYHGTWQDWQLGVSYHTLLRGFDVQPHAVLTYPSRDYGFLGSAATGQRLTRFRIGFDASRRIGRSNAHYAFGDSYEFVDRVLDRNVDRQHLRLSGRYDFSPELSAAVFASVRRSQGADGEGFFRDRPLGNQRWHHHDRLLKQDFGFVGLSSTRNLDSRWALSGSRAWMVSGANQHDVEFVQELQLRRAF